MCSLSSHLHRAGDGFVTTCCIRVISPRMRVATSGTTTAWPMHADPEEHDADMQVFCSVLQNVQSSPRAIPVASCAGVATTGYPASTTCVVRRRTHAQYCAVRLGDEALSTAV